MDRKLAVELDSDQEMRFQDIILTLQELGKVGDEPDEPKILEFLLHISIYNESERIRWEEKTKQRLIAYENRLNRSVTPVEKTLIKNGLLAWSEKTGTYEPTDELEAVMHTHTDKSVKDEKIGCRKCRQKEESYVISEKKYNAGWIGGVESTHRLENRPVVIGKDGEYYDADSAQISYRLLRLDSCKRESFIQEDTKIKYCPYCGADLKKVRKYMRGLENNQEE